MVWTKTQSHNEYPYLENRVDREMVGMVQTLEKTMVAVRREQSSLDTEGGVSPRIERGEITLPRTTPASVSPGRVSELGDTYGDDFEEDTQGDEDSHRHK